MNAHRVEEQQMRRDFNVEHGVHLPADICLNIENPPTRWDVVPLDGDVIETIPDIDDDLLTQVSRTSSHDFLDIKPCLFRQRMSSRRWKVPPMAVRACDIMLEGILEYKILVDSGFPRTILQFVYTCLNFSVVFYCIFARKALMKSVTVSITTW